VPNGLSLAGTEINHFTEHVDSSSCKGYKLTLDLIICNSKHGNYATLTVYPSSFIIFNAVDNCGCCSPLKIA